MPQKSEAGATEPARPYLFVALYADAQREATFRVRPDDLGRHPALDRAVGLTVQILRTTYGERLDHELRAAGLETFLEPIHSARGALLLPSPCSQRVLGCPILSKSRPSSVHISGEELT